MFPNHCIKHCADRPNGLFRGKLLVALCMLTAALCAPEQSSAQEHKPTEYEVKAAYIYNFAKFVEWPSKKPQRPGAALTVCVLGDDPIGPALAAIEGKTVRDRTIMVKGDLSLGEAAACDILFISSSEQEQLDRVLDVLAGAPVLTIGHAKGFAGQGGMINFYRENKTVRFEINLKAAERAGLKISSNLLRIARIVGVQ